jgi:hypothetical protein
LRTMRLRASTRKWRRTLTIPFVTRIRGVFCICRLTWMCRRHTLRTQHTQTCTRCSETEIRSVGAFYCSGSYVSSATLSVPTRSTGRQSMRCTPHLRGALGIPGLGLGLGLDLDVEFCTHSTKPCALATASSLSTVGCTTAIRCMVVPLIPCLTRWLAIQSVARTSSTRAWITYTR